MLGKYLEKYEDGKLEILILPALEHEVSYKNIPEGQVILDIVVRSKRDGKERVFQLVIDDCNESAGCLYIDEVFDDDRTPENLAKIPL